MSVSVLRSCSRAVAHALPEFEVRLASEEWAAFPRPWARVGWATPGTTATRGAAHRDHRRTITVAAYPVEGINAASSVLEAERVAALLTDCVSQGLDPAVISSRNPRRAHPRRLAIFDYAGVGLHEPGPADPVAFARVAESPSVEVVQDAASDASYAVVATVVLGWSEGVLREETGATVATVSGGLRL